MFDVLLVLPSRVWPLLLPLACTPALGERPVTAPTPGLDVSSGAADSAVTSEPASETKPSIPSAFTPCSEDNPTGCKAPTPRGGKLDGSRRYSVEVRVDDPALGPVDAAVTVVVFSDYQCPYCARLEPVLKELRSRFEKELRVVWKDLPLSSHEFALPAALLSREAFIRYGNDRFWRIHDELFLHQSQFSDAWFAAFAQTEQLTWPPNPTYQPRVEQSITQADNLAIAATPTLFINGRPVVGAEHVSVYTDLINEELGR